MVQIDIVGGGIAGLALAAILDPERFEVTVYERRPDRLGLGTALGMWPGARAALRRAGAAEVLQRAETVVGGALRFLDGTPIVDADGAGDALRLVGRADLVRALSRAVPATVRRVTADVDDSGELEGDVVVAADGVHSAVRRHVWGPGSASRVTPFLAVRGLVGRRDAGFGEYWGRGKLFGITPVPGDATNWFSAYRSDMGPRSVDVGEALADARRRFEAAAPAVRAVLAEASPESTLAQRIWVTPPLRRYVRGRTVLIGDAAHAMLPNLGRGACESLIDAHVLGAALNLTDPGDRDGVATALRRYEVQRVAASQAARVGSAAVARIALANRLAPPRDAVLRVLSRRAGSE